MPTLNNKIRSASPNRAVVNLCSLFSEELPFADHRDHKPTALF
jgi:hypothetical protein